MRAAGLGIVALHSRSARFLLHSDIAATSRFRRRHWDKTLWLQRNLQRRPAALLRPLLAHRRRLNCAHANALDAALAVAPGHERPLPTRRADEHERNRDVAKERVTSRDSAAQSPSLRLSPARTTVKRSLESA